MHLTTLALSLLTSMSLIAASPCKIGSTALCCRSIVPLSSNPHTGKTAEWFAIIVSSDVLADLACQSSSSSELLGTDINIVVLRLSVRKNL